MPRQRLDKDSLATAFSFSCSDADRDAWDAVHARIAKQLGDENLTKSAAFRHLVLEKAKDFGLVDKRTGELKPSLRRERTKAKKATAKPKKGKKRVRG
jgi:hypothetical protein